MRRSGTVASCRIRSPMEYATEYRPTAAGPSNAWMTNRSMSTSAQLDIPTGMSGSPYAPNSRNSGTLASRGESDPWVEIARRIGTSMIVQPSAPPAKMPAAPRWPSHTSSTEMPVARSAPATWTFANMAACLEARSTCTSTSVRKLAMKKTRAVGSSTSTSREREARANHATTPATTAVVTSEATALHSTVAVNSSTRPSLCKGQ